MQWEDIWDAWREAQRIPGIGGIGVYFDTQMGGRSRPMIHVDCRPERMMWVREAGKYLYYHRSPREFFKAIVRSGLKEGVK